MWFKRGTENSAKTTIINISAMPEVQNQEQGEPEHVDAGLRKAKRVWRMILAVGWAPVSLAFFLLFLCCFRNNLFKMTEEEQGRLLSTYALFLGFYITVRYVFFQLRESKSLAEFRKTVQWMIVEYCSYVGWLLLFATTIVGIIDYLLTEPSIVLYAAELSMLFTALIYALVDFLAATRAYIYIK